MLKRFNLNTVLIVLFSKLRLMCIRLKHILINCVLSIIYFVPYFDDNYVFEIPKFVNLYIVISILAIWFKQGSLTIIYLAITKYKLTVVPKFLTQVYNVFFRNILVSWVKYINFFTPTTLSWTTLSKRYGYLFIFYNLKTKWLSGVTITKNK